jgi:beta-lactamase regulating signal transducer with metallopeptidase domain
VNASSIPMASSQTAVLTVSNWSNLNSTSSAANLQVFNPTSTVAVASYTLVNAQQSLPTKSNVSTLLSVAVIISAAVVVSVLLYVRQRRTRRHNEGSS